jgi:hypothetical protein
MLFLPQNERQLERSLTRRTEDDERVPRHLIDQMNQVHLFELEWDEEVVLQELVHGLESIL